MARILYALSGQGRGHTSRVMAISDLLRQRGHELWFCCGGTAQEILAAEGEQVLPVPALRQDMQGNTLRLGPTVRRNSRALRMLSETVAELAEDFAALRPDLLITDFETFSARAAERIGLPVLSFNHQQVVTETRYRLPLRSRLHALLAVGTIRFIVPKDPVHVLLTSFFFPPLKRPERTTLVPPIIRPAVQRLRPAPGGHVLVYYNDPAGSEYLLDVLRRVEAPFIVYNFTPPARPQAYPNVQFKTPSLDGFLADLAGSRAVLCTAGFTLISEALFLGKPLLVTPNHGIFEQTLNALFLQKGQLGEAVLGRRLTVRDVAAFLNRCDGYSERLRNRPACGNKDAVACIEGVLSRLGPKGYRHPGLPYASADAAPLTGVMTDSE